MLRIENLTKSYIQGIVNRASLPVLNGVSFTIEKGCSVGLMGNSGSGKSTLARILVGLLPADGGHVFFKSRDITYLKNTQRNELRRQIQLVFQNPESSLNPRMTILQNMLEPMSIHKMASLKERKSKLADKLNLVGLSDKLLSRYPREVSGGEAQRIVLARILTLEPEFIILDEPTSMLDMSVQAQILNLLKQLQSDLGLTYLLISHDAEIIHWFSDSAYILKNGELQQLRK